jgi:AcrR family transcriptional regulator/DNA-binding MarR family transcriptional regulator
MSGAAAVAVEAANAGRGRVVEIQRARMVAAMSELVRERGVAVVTVGHVVERAGVSRRTFYELFEDREDCLRAAFEHAIDRALAAVVPAYEVAGGAWQERIRAGLAALLRFLDAERTLGRLCVVAALAAGPAVLERRGRVVDALVDAVHRGGVAAHREQGSSQGHGRPLPRERRPARIVAEGVVGAVLGIVYARLTAGEERPVAGLQRQLMSMIVLPYLGSAAAERELARPAPRSRLPARREGDPLRDLEMRLTYRTVRVLQAIAELGGRESGGGQASSNREVADAAGVQDQGQISKLLSRLEQLGLVANEVTSTPGAANAWTLTPRGREVERTIRAQAGG